MGRGMGAHDAATAGGEFDVTGRLGARRGGDEKGSVELKMGGGGRCSISSSVNFEISPRIRYKNKIPIHHFHSQTHTMTELAQGTAM